MSKCDENALTTFTIKCTLNSNLCTHHSITDSSVHSKLQLCPQKNILQALGYTKVHNQYYQFLDCQFCRHEYLPFSFVHARVHLTRFLCYNFIKKLFNFVWSTHKSKCTWRVEFWPLLGTVKWRVFRASRNFTLWTTTRALPLTCWGGGGGLQYLRPQLLGEWPTIIACHAFGMTR